MFTDWLCVTLCLAPSGFLPLSLFHVQGYSSFPFLIWKTFILVVYFPDVLDWLSIMWGFLIKMDVTYMRSELRFSSTGNSNNCVCLRKWSTSSGMMRGGNDDYSLWDRWPWNHNILVMIEFVGLFLINWQCNSLWKKWLDEIDKQA